MTGGEANGHVPCPGRHAAPDRGFKRSGFDSIGSVSADYSRWISRISAACRDGVASTFDLARVMAEFRAALRRGGWARLWENQKLGKGQALPFRPRKAEMLVVIGKRLSWVNPQSFARLPVGWSILYTLARLNRGAFEQCLESGAIDPDITLSEAKALVARLCRRSSACELRQTSVTRRLIRFRDYVQRTLDSWSSEERKLANVVFAELLDQLQTEERGNAESPADHPKSL
jgi:hypothetical protein